MTRSLLSIAVVAAVLCWFAAPLHSQQTSGGTFGSRTLGGGISGSAGNRSQGISQSGTLSSSAAIQRTAGETIGGAAGNFLSRTGGTGAGGFTGQRGAFGTTSQFGTGFGNQQFGQAGAAGQGANTTPTVRAVVRLGFSRRTISANSVRVISLRLTKIPQLNSVDGQITVTMQGRTAVLRGEVSTDRQRSLASRLVSFEPGVGAVQNELKVVAVPPVPRR